AIFDGSVFRPAHPVELRPHTRVRLSIEWSQEETGVSFLDTAQSLNLNGPPDWSVNLDEYLYGDKKNGA
ncbi:MAG: antitoxin family protein, partial [Anaerolineae bacterium]